MDWLGLAAERCNASAQETVVFPTPPFPTTNVSLATEGFYRKGREGRKELLKEVQDILCLKLKAATLAFEFIFKFPFAAFATFAVNPRLIFRPDKILPPAANGPRPAGPCGCGAMQIPRAPARDQNTCGQDA